MAWTTVAAVVVASLGLLVGLAGVALPVLPGVPLAGAVVLAAGWIVGFERFGLDGVIGVVVLVVLAQVVDFAAGAIGARRYGARRAGVWGGIVGSLVGLVVLPPWGVFPGALGGAVLFELLAGREPSEAWRAGVGAFVGTLGGVLAKVAILVAMAVFVFPRLVGG